MAVRFLPTPEERPQSHREERGDLAEVIEFRSRLRRPDPAEAVEAVTEVEPTAAASPKPPARLMKPVQLAEPVQPAEPAGDVRPDEAELLVARESAMQRAVKLLARRPLSSGELRLALLDAEYPESDAEQAVAECEASLYLDDADLARSVTRKLRDSKGASRSRIRQKLRERRLPDATIEAALAELDDDEELQLLRQTAKDRATRLTGLERQVAERRLLGFLARRGWSGERATRAVRDALDGSGAKRAGDSVRFQ